MANDASPPGRSRGRRVAVSAVVLSLLTACSTTPEEPTGMETTPSRSTRAAPSSEPAGPTPTMEPSAKKPAELSAAEQRRLDLRLIDAAWDGDVRRALRLVRAGANVNHKDETEQSAYLIATSEGYLELLELTLRHGANVRSLDSFDGTGLIRAAERGHADIVGRLLQTDIAVDHVNNLGWTALHEAIILGDGSQRYVDTVRLLVAGGADVALRSRNDGVTPVEHARAKGFAEIARTLERVLGADPPPNPDRALLTAAAAGEPDRVALALRAGAGLETRDSHRRTPLLLAAANDHVHVARLLVALGADPDALDDRHDTPWLVTGVTGSVPMLETLLPADPDLTIRNRYGGISVIPASERGHVDYVRRVVRTPIDVDHVNDLGWTALLEAVILGDGSEPYRQIVRILLEAGADPSIADGEGVTALEHAERRGHEEIARILRRADQ